MPYSIRKSGNKFKVINTRTRKTKGTHGSRALAQRQVNLLNAVKHGFKPTGRKKKR